MTIKERFWSKTKTSTEHSYNGTPCIDWTGAAQSRGYGNFGLRPSRTIRSHRFAYQLEHGVIPSGMFVCHHCDRPCCVNPEHLFLGTPQDNIDDMKAKGRSAKGRMENRKGSCNHNSRLNETSVALIKQFLQRHPPSYSCKFGSCRFLADWFGVGRTTISDIGAGKRWPHVKVEGVAS